MRDPSLGVRVAYFRAWVERLGIQLPDNLLDTLNKLGKTVEATEDDRAKIQATVDRFFSGLPQEPDLLTKAAMRYVTGLVFSEASTPQVTAPAETNIADTAAVATDNRPTTELLPDGITPAAAVNLGNPAEIAPDRTWIERHEGEPNPSTGPVR